MMRAAIYNIYYNGLEFLRANKFKLIIVLIIGLCGCGFGIAGAMSIDIATVNIRINKFSIVLLSRGTRGFFGYLMLKLFSCVVIFSIMAILSYRFFLSLFNIVLLFLYCFFTVRMIVLVLIMLKFTFIPVVVLCLVPTFIIQMLIFSCIVVFSLQKSYEFRYYRYNNFFGCIGQMYASGVGLMIFLFVSCILESILAFILTMGVVI